MEKKKLLFPLKICFCLIIRILLFYNIFNNVGFGGEDNNIIPCDSRCIYKKSNIDDIGLDNIDINLDNRLYVLVSSSMSSNLIKEYMKEVRKYNGLVVLNGLIENDLRKTVNFLFDIELYAKNKGGVIIDPRIFKKFHIDKVPTIILSIHDEASNSIIYDKISGAVDIRYALELFSKSGDTKSYAKELL